MSLRIKMGGKTTLITHDSLPIAIYTDQAFTLTQKEWDTIETIIERETGIETNKIFSIHPRVFDDNMDSYTFKDVVVNITADNQLNILIKFLKNRLGKFGHTIKMKKNLKDRNLQRVLKNFNY